VGLHLPLFFPFFGVLKHNPSQNSERDGASALNGNHFTTTRNNQPNNSVRGGGGIGEETWLGRNVWEDVVTYFFAIKLADNKIKKIQYAMALGSCQLAIKHNNQPKTRRRS
jgi:hypothetical protein